MEGRIGTASVAEGPVSPRPVADLDPRRGPGTRRPPGRGRPGRRHHLRGAGVTAARAQRGRSSNTGSRERPGPALPMERLARLLVAWAINAAALWVASRLFGGVHIHGREAYLLGAAVLGVANAVLKPILTLLTLPLVVATLGFFLLLINIAMLALAVWVAPNFSIDGFWTYAGTVVVIWLVNWAAGTLVDRAGWR